MRSSRASLPLLFLVTAVFATAAAAQTTQPLSSLAITDKARIALQKLPYYGPFDLIGFSVKGSAVTLNGWVYQAINKDDASDDVKKVPGVTQVVNNIQVLPASISDDQIRRAVFRAIYSDDFLQKYGTPIMGLNGGQWGRRAWGRGMGGFGFGGGGALSGFGNFPGSEPVGNYAIHIIVNGGKVGLFGTVNNDTDKTKAGMDARGVFGVMSVDNELQVVKD